MFEQEFIRQIADALRPVIREEFERAARETLAPPQAAPDDEDLIDVNEVARMLGCHPRTVVTKEKALKGFPKGIRSGKRAIRWKRGEIRAFIANAPRGVGNLTAL